MDGLMYIIMICIVAPLSLMLPLLRGRDRSTVIAMLVGIFMCVFVSEINGLLLRLTTLDTVRFTTTVTPVTEEICKAIPVFLFGFAISDDRERLVSISMAVGIGFAVIENTYILVSSVYSASILWAFVRGVGAGLMHGICTSMVGLGVSFIRKRKKLFYTGTFGLLASAMIYHSLYNMLVQSSFKYVGVLLPLATYAPIVYLWFRSRAKRQSLPGAAAK